MRELEGIARAVDELEPHREAIEAAFETERQRFANLFSRSHDHIGRILKCHWVIEHYLDRNLSEELGLGELRGAKLTFFQKISILPDRDFRVTWIKPGILNVNSLRNRLVHNLEARLEDADMGGVKSVLSIARKGFEPASVVEAVEAFTPVACTFLTPKDKRLAGVFAKAFAHVKFRKEL